MKQKSLQIVEKAFSRKVVNNVVFHEYRFRKVQKEIDLHHLQLVPLPNIIAKINEKEQSANEQLPIVTKIDFQKCSIKDEGCYEVSKLDINHNFHLILNTNDIQGKGCLNLSDKRWNYLQGITLVGNDIKSDGCNSIFGTEWANLQYLNLGKCKIGPKGCLNISKTKLLQLQTLNICVNQIGTEGCKYLSEFQGRKLKELIICNQIFRKISLSSVCNIGMNKIHCKGCYWLPFGMWKSVVHLNLVLSGMREKGCEWLTKLESQVLQKWGQSIGKQGHKYLLHHWKEIVCDVQHLSD